MFFVKKYFCIHYICQAQSQEKSVNMSSYQDTYGEMDEVFIIPSIHINSISNKVNEKTSEPEPNPKPNPNPETIPSTIKLPITTVKKVSSINKIIPKKQSIKTNTKIKIAKTPEERLREIARIQARRNRARRKSEYLASIKYSESLLKMNANLKYEVSHLKKRRDELIQQCKQNIKK